VRKLYSRWILLFPFKKKCNLFSPPPPPPFQPLNPGAGRSDLFQTVGCIFSFLVLCEIKSRFKSLCVAAVPRSAARGRHPDSSIHIKPNKPRQRKTGDTQQNEMFHLKLLNFSCVFSLTHTHTHTHTQLPV